MGMAIVAINNGTSLTITTNGAILGDDVGINARNYGTAGLTINVNDDVTGTTGDGIYAYNSANDVTASMVINQAAGTTTTGALYGINANNFGGSLTINALGTSIGIADDGIRARNHVGTTDLTITANNATGNDYGIDANNQGTGALTITTMGAITGTTDDGIRANNGSNGTNLTITVMAGSVVTGNDEGIDADNNGTGTSVLTINGTVNATNDEGIEFDDSSTSGAVTITVGATGVVTSGDDDAIEADADGVGDLTVIVDGRVVGDSDALDLDKDGTGNIIVVTGVGSYIRGVDFDGVETDISTAGGTTSITVNGTVVAGDNGIEADDDAVSGAMTITTGVGSSITADDSGIDADHDGTGALTITVSGIVRGGTDYGIKTQATAGDPTLITLNAGAVVSAASGNAIYNDAGDSTVTVNGGASVLGTIALGDGSDDLIFAGGDFTGVTLFDGGDDSDTADGFIDTLTFAGSSGAVDSSLFVNWEALVIGAGINDFLLQQYADNANDHYC